MPEQTQSSRTTDTPDTRTHAMEGGAQAFSSGVNFSSFLSSPDPNKLTPDVAISLQRTIGNQALIQLLRQNGSDIQRTGDKGISSLLKGQLTAIREGSVELKQTAENHIKNMATDTNGVAMIPEPKGMDRIIAKALDKIQAGRGDSIDVGKQIKDILRGSIVYDDFESLRNGYAYTVKTLRSMSYQLTFTKMAETFTDAGKEANAASKGTDKDTSGYGDAKLVFNLDLPKTIMDKFIGKKGMPKFIPVEVQFQTKAALAVKSGKVGDDENWQYRMQLVEDGPWRFNAIQFVADMVERMEDNNTSSIEDQLLLAQLPAHGLPPAHDVYDKKKKAKMDPLDVENAEKFYPKLYEMAFRYSQMGNQDNAMAQDIDKFKTTYKQYFKK